MSSIAATDDAPNANIFTDKTRLFCVIGFKGDDELLETPQPSQSVSESGSRPVSRALPALSRGEPTTDALSLPADAMPMQRYPRKEMQGMHAR